MAVYKGIVITTNEKYLFYTRTAFGNFYVYICECKDPFHTMGEMYYRNIVKIDRLDFVECTEEKLKFWKDKKQEILIWENKYEGGKI